MDTKTPPIPLKHQEKRQQIRKQEKTDLSLPPLTGQTNAGRHRNADKKNPGPQWANGTPYVNKEDHQSKRPYRVLHIGATPLMHACQQGDRSRVLRLLREQEDTINYRDRTLRNALHYCMDASTGGAVASAAPELVNAPDAEGHTPLHLAVIAGDTQLVAVLLANGADVNARDLEGHSVLHWATVCGEAECVRLVLAAGAKPSTPDLRGGSPLHYAAQCCGAAVTAELSVPKKVGLKVLHTLLEFGADVNAKDEDGRQPILWAASAGSVEAVLALARAGGSAAAGATDKDGLTALHCAASRGHARCVEALVNLCGSQPDHVDDNGCSALHYAATLGHADATALLLRLGADPNRQDRKGRTPALCAAAKGQLETLKILAQHGGSLHARTVRGTGVAHEAVLSGRIELIEWLARRKPSTLDVATHDGRTPLHVAALHGYLDTCKVLLDHGARINAIFRTSKSGSMTPLDAALYRGNRDCAKLIQMHGGATAQHIRTHRTAPNRVFAAKVKIKHGASSSPTDSESSHHQEADVYIEEHWIEKRTRKHSTPRKREERRDSRSFSEEEVRLSKTSRRDRRRRAKSESARYENVEIDSSKSSRRKSSKHEYSESSSEFSESSDGVVERRTTRRHRKSESHDDRSLSDDSLEVVVVRRSVEKKSEKVQYSDKKKKPKETSKETRTTETERSSSRKKSRSDKKKAKSDRRKKRQTSDSEEESASTPKRKEDKKFDKDMTDSTSQETVERVVVTALVHKDQAPDTPTPGPGKPKKDEKHEVKEEMKSKMESKMESKMDDILEKADEMQTVLMAKAADLKKDVDNIRRQVTEEVPLADEDEEEEVHEEEKGRKEEKIDDESNSDDSQREFSRLQSQRGGETGGETGSLFSKEEDSEEKEEKRSSEESKEEEIKDKDKEEEETQEKEASPPEEKSEKSAQSGKSSPVKESESEKDSQSADSKSVESKSERETPVTPEGKEETDHEKEDDDEAVEFGEKGSESSESVRETPKTENLGEKIDEENDEETIIDSPTVSSKKVKKSQSSRPSTAKSKSRESSSKSPAKGSLLESPEEDSPDRSAIVAVIESPEWDEEDDEVAKEIQKVVGDNTEMDTEPEDDDEDDDDDLGVLRVLPSTSEEETPRRLMKVLKAPKFDTLSRVEGKSISSPRGLGVRTKQRKDSGGRDSGIEPSPRVSKIPKRTLKCCPNTEKQEALNMETIQRDVQISLRRYHLERKIFFQLMELKRLQIRHGKVNEHILVKRQVETFHKSGMAGPILGVARYDQPLTFRHFEAFLYEQLRRLQRRPASPDWCTEARQCTQKTHRCHHATSAYTSVPIYGYLDGGSQEREEEGTLLPRIENRGRGQMTVEVTKGEEKQVISLPAEKLDRTKRYFITFTVRGEAQNSEILNAPRNAQRNTKSV